MENTARDYHRTSETATHRSPMEPSRPGRHSPRTSQSPDKDTRTVDMRRRRRAQSVRSLTGNTTNHLVRQRSRSGSMFRSASEGPTATAWETATATKSGKATALETATATALACSEELGQHSLEGQVDRRNSCSHCNLGSASLKEHRRRDQYRKGFCVRGARQ